MKLILYLISLLSILHLIYSKKHFSNKSKYPHQVPQYLNKILTSKFNYKSPEIINKLPYSSNSNLNTGDIEYPSTIPSKSTYYSGKHNLNVVKIPCDLLHKSPYSCIQHPQCGYCITSQKCITGTPKGPSMKKCFKKYFVYDKQIIPQTPRYSINSTKKPLIHITRKYPYHFSFN